MALSESSRSQIYLGLVNFVGEEAIGEMMSYFPARDVEEPVTKEFLRAEMSDLRSETSNLRAELKADISDLRAEMSDLRAELKADISDLRAEMSDLRAELKADIAHLQGEMTSLKHMMVMNAGLVASVGAVIVAAIRL